MSINLARYYPYTLLVSVLQPTNSSIVSLEVKDFHRFRENLIWNFSPYDPIYIEGICSVPTELLDHHHFKERNISKMIFSNLKYSYCSLVDYVVCIIMPGMYL